MRTTVNFFMETFSRQTFSGANSLPPREGSPTLILDLAAFRIVPPEPDARQAPSSVVRSDPVRTWLAQFYTDKEIDHPDAKRGPYGHHKDQLDDKNITRAFAALALPVPYGGLKALAMICHVKRPILSTWQANLQVDPTWRPTRDAYVRARRVLTDDEEQETLQHIVKTFMSPGHTFATRICEKR
jgi:hypothetical protein